MTKKIQNMSLRKYATKVSSVASTPGSSVRSAPGWPGPTETKGIDHPPKKRVVTMAHTVTTLAYSAMKKKENFIALYSVWYPAMSSDSASGKSNGTRLVSAKPETRKMKNERKRGSTYHSTACWSAMRAEKRTLP